MEMNLKVQAARCFPPSQVKKRLGEVTATEVRTAARDIFRPERFTLALVSPLKSAAGLDKLLAA